jgi:hypothetical protein
MASAKQTELHVSRYQPSANLKTASYALLGIGVLTLIIGLIKNPERFWTSYLTAFFFFSTLGLGGMFWIAVNNVSKAGWSVTIRRYAEAMTSFVPVMLLGSLALILGLKYLYPWANHDIVANNPVIAAKTSYLNVGFLVFRMLLFCGGVWFFRSLIVGGSLKQDKDGDEKYTHKNVGFSVAFILFFAIFFSLFSVDLLMSLLPSWYSTIFGVYCFSGMFQAALAFIALMLVYLKRIRAVRGYVTDEHQHDVAKFMKGFTVFWAYIAFSQFMLIWYANIPEETEYYIMRSQHGWLGVSMALLIFRFIVPFVALLPKGLKRNDSHLVAVSILILAMQYLDIYWMVYPNFYEGHVTFGFWEIGMMAFFGGLFMIGLMGFLARNSLVPLKDPRLHEAVNHQVTY